MAEDLGEVKMVVAEFWGEDWGHVFGSGRRIERSHRPPDWKSGASRHGYMRVSIGIRHLKLYLMIKIFLWME
ncbi:MAG: hypothetical protein SCH39_10970 [Methanosarcinales archaeon]|nr:hypothetical protein [Methanosarcinales archaeon]